MEERFVVPPAWGVAYHNGIKEHYSWRCPHCNLQACYPDELEQNPLGWYKFIVGFTREIPHGSIRSGMHREDKQVVGSMIIECPRCFEKYYVHITIEEIKWAIEKCPAWPQKSHPE